MDAGDLVSRTAPMKTRSLRILENAAFVLLLLVYAGFALRRAAPSLFAHTPPGLARISGTASYYMCSDRKAIPREGLPVIICIGSTFETPAALTRFAGEFDEPVLLVWSSLLSDLSGETPLEDETVWDTKRQKFPRLLARYRKALHFDDRRVYLTGSGFAGAYAWMLAYDRPDCYAGVVAMSAPWYPPPIQQRLGRGKSVITVVAYGETDRWLTNRLAQAKEVRQAIESRNPHSRFILKPGADRSAVARDWVENLKYILQFKKEAPP